MGALAQQRQASDGFQGSIHNVICTELDDKTDKLTGTLPNNSAHVEKLFMLRRDTSTHLGAQSALRHGTREEVAAVGNVFVDNADETANVKDRSPRNTSRHVYVRAGNKSRNNCSRRMTMSLTTVPNFRFDDSTDSESDDSDDE